MLLASCAYFNGIYNAKEAARRAEKQLRAGKDGEAAASFASAAIKAETVLARYPGAGGAAKPSTWPASGKP